MISVIVENIAEIGHCLFPAPAGDGLGIEHKTIEVKDSRLKSVICFHLSSTLKRIQPQKGIF
jgi:hypothetical protein